MENLYKHFGRRTNRRVQAVKYLVLIAVLLTVSLGGVGSNPQPTQATEDYGARGPYPVGTMDLVLEDADRPLDITVWYPAQNPDGAPEEMTYNTTPPKGVEDYLPVFGRALADAIRAGDGPFPLVIYSHGNEMYRQEAVYLTEQLASHGFVVFAADHFGDSLSSLLFDGESLERIEADTADYLIYRPQDITRLIDFASAMAGDGGDLSGVIDVEQVAVVGHSFGGYTALAAGGARLNFDEFDQIFLQNSEYPAGADDAPAEVLPNLERIAEIAGLDVLPEGTWPSLADPRIDAIVPLAPGFTPLFGRTGLESVTVPLLIIVGTQDYFIPLEFFTSWVFENVASERKFQVIMEDATHFVFTNSCEDAAPWFPWCDTGWDESAYSIINHYVTAFLLAELTGDADAYAALSLTSPGVTVR